MTTPPPPRPLRLVLLLACLLPAAALPAAAPRGVTGVTSGNRDLFRPPSTPVGKTWIYQMSYPFQVSADTAGIFCAIREGEAKAGGLQAGVDVLLFRRLEELGRATPIVVTRNELAPNPRAQPPGQLALMVKISIQGGFVPYGAKRPDGSPHPHAGTGFGVALAIAQKTGGAQGSLAEFSGAEAYHYRELHQFRYDGKAFTIVDRQKVELDELLPGHELVNAGLANAIPDGDDLLMGMVARGRPQTESGVVRWRRANDRWRPIAYHPVSALGGEGDSSEPTLVRDLDDSLLFCARGGRDEPALQNDIRIWRSRDDGRTWQKIIHARGLISTAPVTLNRAADGTPYVAANLYEVFLEAPHAGGLTDSATYSIKPDSAGRYRLGGWLRNTVCLWPLNAERNALEAPLVAFDGRDRFGPPPGGSSWRVDHPVSMPVRLADRKWHSLLSLRVLELAEGSHGIPPTPHTGLYLEEVLARGEDAPLWNF
ncbi:MAG: hypothetical protein JNG83_08105 [Opitutaceae bacterium]|nr:hypothetical protein [Opitutaceae bacterium]